MFKHNKLLVAAVGASAVLGSGAASAVEFKTSDWTFSATGNINVHYIYTMCDRTTHVVAGSLLCNTGPGAGGFPDEQRNSSSIANGLLPAALVFGAATTQNGFDIAATVGFYPGIASNDFGLNGPNIQNGDTQQNGLDTTNLDLRQVFLTFGNDTFGEIKMGRDFGLFGYDAIINDMTIPGVGVAQGFAARSPVNTTLGSIGFGYIYTDTPAQINYTTPSLAGLTATVGVFQPYDALNLSGFSAQTTNATSNQPGFHAKLNYEWTGPVPGFVSISGITEDVRNLTFPDLTGTQVEVKEKERAYAGDITAKVTAFGLDLLGSYYYTQGWGHTGFLFDGFDALGNRRKSTGYLGQVTYTIPGSNTKIGANYGVNNLSANPGDPVTLLHQNSKYTVGVYHNLTPNLTLLAEYSDARSVNNNSGDINTRNINVGAYLAF